MFPIRIFRILVVLSLWLPATGCYYIQAARGQMEVLNRREPIDEVIADPVTSAELSRQLALVRDARDFSVDRLGLPDNPSYRSYSDLERDFVIWNVFAAPEFSLVPHKWCYPIVGCVAYRGYFTLRDARRQAERLGRKGFDVAVGGVTAYSTLGRFDDPVLNTMLRWDDLRLVATLFHELAHQVLYIKDDTRFNESFATAVEEIGIELWLESRGDAEDIEHYRAQKEKSRRIFERVNAARADLQVLYARELPADEMRMLKEARFAQLSVDIGAILSADGREVGHWLSEGLNNARLLPVSIYEDRVPAFRSLYVDCSRDFACLYERARELSELDEPDREERLDALAANAAISEPRAAVNPEAD